MEQDIIKVIFKEEEIIRTFFTEKEIIKATFKQVDRIGSLERFIDAIEKNTVYGEKPIRKNDKTFETEYNFIEGTLRVYFNGIRENINIISENIFQLPVSTFVDDEIIVDYIKRG